MTRVKVLLTGATGYIGGTVLSTLLASQSHRIRDISITVLVRRQEQADKLVSSRVTPLIFSGLDDLELLERAASEHDVVIHTASGFHTASAEALIAGLRKRNTYSYYVHTSGTWNLAEASLADLDAQLLELTDNDDILKLEKELQAERPFSQRATDLRVMSAVADSQVKAYIIMPPDVYGYGTGLFAKTTPQIEGMARDALKHGQAAYIRNEDGIVGYVHVADLAALYVVLLEKLFNDHAAASVSEGIYFCSTGTHRWQETAARIGELGFRDSHLVSAIPKAMRIHEAAERWSGGDVRDLRMGYCSRFSTKPDKAMDLGWRPQKDQRDWLAWIDTSFQAALKSQEKDK
ncbi:unnamed protein product [Clonostachys byssicola]|uniref:NAD-dependent epimerase/dehydratase domain-containing protein n=1 Tax=Clonostachys byssicola TaxID=160290 RepID=A0A9N9Y640_9HYPO|nr:unnamed protein product [Clonostachys byssicola]